MRMPELRGCAASKDERPRQIYRTAKCRRTSESGVRASAETEGEEDVAPLRCWFLAMQLLT